MNIEYNRIKIENNSIQLKKIGKNLCFEIDFQPI